jgi:phospholipid/cholesterol/gamma-HCH transport system substrate-binding protein
VRAPVTVAGVEIGSVTAIDPRPAALCRPCHHADQRQRECALPVDSAAMILTQGMLGQQYIGISIGAEEKMLSDGNRFKSTQSALVLEDLIGKFLTSSIDKSGSK